MVHASVFAMAAIGAFCSCAGGADRALGDDAYADAVASYAAGTGVGPYTQSAAALGEPTRFTGEGIFPSCVTPFNPAFGLDEIVSIGNGGHLTVRFNTPVTDDPNNPYGVDLIIFGNTGFSDTSYPNGIVGTPFEPASGSVEVSANGATWVMVTGATADGLFPTLGYTDKILYETTAGSVLTNFTRPIDPDLTLANVLGMTATQVAALYQGGGGGQGVDLTGTGLSAISFVRFTNTSASNLPEVDGVADVSPRLAGDANFDGSVDINDLTLVVLGWGTNPPGGIPADFDNDDDIDIDDLTSVILNWK